MSITYKAATDFVRSLYPGTKTVPLHVPVFTGQEKKNLNECIETTFVSYVGPFVTKFEELISNYIGVKKAVAFVNGTTALQLALKVVGVLPGDEVITQGLSFIATANAISHAGAEPVFVDIERSTLGMDPAALANFLETHVSKNAEGQPINNSTGARISACVPVHVFGHIGDMESLKHICKDYGIPIVEDGAESIGSTYRGKHAGTFGETGILSFNGNKTITAGAGGMLVTDNEEMAARAQHLSTTAKTAHRWEFIHDEIGYNFRMSNLNAAVGCAQMEYLDSILESKRQIAKEYAGFFKGTDITFVEEPANCRSNYWLNTVIGPDPSWRDEFLSFANDNGIQARAVWKPATLLEMYADRQHTDLSNTMWVYEHAVNLPSSPRL